MAYNDRLYRGYLGSEESKYAREGRRMCDRMNKQENDDKNLALTLMGIFLLFMIPIGFASDNHTPVKQVYTTPKMVTSYENDVCEWVEVR